MPSAARQIWRSKESGFGGHVTSPDAFTCHRDNVGLATAGAALPASGAGRGAPPASGEFHRLCRRGQIWPLALRFTSAVSVNLHVATGQFQVTFDSDVTLASTSRPSDAPMCSVHPRNARWYSFRSRLLPPALKQRSRRSARSAWQAETRPSISMSAAEEDRYHEKTRHFTSSRPRSPAYRALSGATISRSLQPTAARSGNRR